MNTKPAQSTIKRECRRLSKQLRTEIERANRRRTRLRGLIHNTTRRMAAALRQAPDFWEDDMGGVYGDFKQSFELFSVQLQDLSRYLQEQVTTGWQPGPAPGNGRLDAWQEYTADLTEALEDQQAACTRQYRTDLLKMLELLDTAERLERLELPRAVANKQQRRYIKALQRLQQVAFYQVARSIRTSLKDRGVEPVRLAVGAYPDATITHIVSQSGQANGKNLAVAEVVEQGYFWRDEILRKTTVITTTISPEQESNING